nr:DUF2637 domain-containing protein [Micromonospora sp. DSM 115978]
MPLAQLRRVRWAVRATLTLGVAASVVANILHAQDNPISQAIAAWPPLALLLTVELISRVPVHRRSLAAARLAATAIIAGIAAWVSYWHMVGVAARYGETGASPYLLPLSVDGLIVVASICLVELGGQISNSEAETTPAGTTTAAPTPLASPSPATISAAATATAPTVASSAAPPHASPAHASPAHASPAHAAPTYASPALAVVPVRSRITSTDRPVPDAEARPDRKTVPGNGSAEAAPAVVEMTGFHPTATKSGGRPKASGRPRRPVAETAALAAAIQADRPDVSEVEVARELGITPARLRAIRRQTRDLDLAA